MNPWKILTYYVSGTDGGGHQLYIIGNGPYGPEIFASTVINNFQAKDEDGNTGTYTGLQLTGTGYTYNGTDNTLSKVSYGF